MAALVTPSVSNAGLSWRRIVRLKSNRWVSFVNVTGGLAVAVSDDYGQTWQTCTTPVGGIIDTRASAVVAADPDEDDVIHVLVGSYTSAQVPLDYYQVTAAGLTATAVKTQVEAAPGTNYGWQRVDIVVHSGAAGATKNIIIAYHKTPVDTTGTQNLYVRSATVTTAGVITLGTRYQVDTNNEGGTRHLFAISKSASGACKMLYQRAGNLTTADALVNMVTLTAPMTSAPGQISVAPGFYYLDSLTSIDGLGACMWLGSDLGNAYVWHETDRTGTYGTWKQFSGTTYDMSLSGVVIPAATGDLARDCVIIVGQQAASPNKLRLLEVNYTTKAITDKGVWGQQAVGSYRQHTARSFDGLRVPVLYGAADGVYTETFSYAAPRRIRMVV